MNVKRRATKRTTAYVIQTEFKMERRVTGRATSYIKQPEIKMDHRATKRATQHINRIWNKTNSSRDEAHDAAR
jgi:hypothetical protein